MKKLLLVALICSVSFAQAQSVVFRDIDPDKTIAAMWPAPGGDTVQIAYDTSSSTPITLRVILDSAGANITCLGGDCQILDSTSSSLVAKLDSMTLVEPNPSYGTWVTPDAIKGELLMDPNGGGHWEQSMYRYMAIRFKLNGVWKYGWVHMTVFYAFGSGMLNVMIKDLAYNTKTDDPIKTSSTTSVSDIYTKLKNVSVSVMHKQITVNGIKGAYSYKLLDLNGRVVITAKSYHTTTINIPGVASGMYILHLRNKDGVYTTKVFVD